MSKINKNSVSFSGGAHGRGSRKASTQFGFGDKRFSLVLAAGAAILSLTGDFFAARARWTTEPKKPLQPVLVGAVATQVPVMKERPRALLSEPQKPEATEPEPEAVTKESEVVAPETEGVREIKPAETPVVKETGSPRLPVLAYSPMGRPISRIFVNTRTNEPPARIELKTGLDRTLNLIANAVPGMRPPPKLDLRTPGEDILKSLDTDVILLQDDEASLAMAGNVANLKKELKKYLSEGGNVEDFVGTYQQWLQQSYEARQAVQSQVAVLLRKGDTDGAQRLAEEHNAAFAKEGIAPISIPLIHAK